ncbi:MazG family protein [Butyrivibrio sp. AE3006]|uniref:MazG family protein n=1 Tax=Butyrivibrio sp. AE3006 TaxID=1280673 RepID=UPI0004011CEF|nr:MazG family protein [Butyrivibrio sp. AE3006]
MKSFDELKEVVRKLRAPDGCPWDREQTHSSLKPGCIEEAAEVLCGINVYERTGNPENLKEELGDLLLQVVMQAQIAEEEGIFTMDDVAKGITEKLIRRHPHVFGDVEVADSKEVLKNWDEIKAKEKEGKEDPNLYLPEAFDEAENLINAARKRKGFS